MVPTFSASASSLHALRTWLDSWAGIGHVAVGMARQGYDLQLTRYDEKGMARDLLHERDGALADGRDRDRLRVTDLLE